jgi:hypothetical protein
MADMKAAFHAVRAHLIGEKNRLAKVATGPAFEGWLNAEIALCLNDSTCIKHDHGEVIWPEKTKRDIVIVRADGKAGWVIEVKLIYPWRPSKIQESLDRLRTQVIGRSRTYADEKNARTRRSGFIFGVWLDMDSQPPSWDKKLTKQKFFRLFTERVLSTFPGKRGAGFKIQSRTPYYAVRKERPPGWYERATVGMMYVTAP